MRDSSIVPIRIANKIRKDFLAGKTLRKIGREYGYGRTRLRNILFNKTSKTTDINYIITKNKYKEIIENNWRKSLFKKGIKHNFNIKKKIILLFITLIIAYFVTQDDQVFLICVLFLISEKILDTIIFE